MVIVVIIDGIYCAIMKKLFGIDSKERRIVKDDLQNTDSTGQKKSKTIRAFLLTIADGFTFAFFKVVGYVPSHVIRKIFYKYVFRMDIGRKAIIYYGLEARSPWNIKIEDGSIVGDKAILDARYGIEIGKNVNISTGAWLWTLQHDINSASFTSRGTEGKIIIGDRAWIASRTILLPGCNVAEGCVVASGAVVTRPIFEPYSVVGGVPAKKIGDRNKEINYCFDGKHRPFL